MIWKNRKSMSRWTRSWKVTAIWRRLWNKKGARIGLMKLRSLTIQSSLKRRPKVRKSKKLTKF